VVAVLVVLASDVRYNVETANISIALQQQKFISIFDTQCGDGDPVPGGKKYFCVPNYNCRVVKRK